MLILISASISSLIKPVSAEHGLLYSSHQRMFIWAEGKYHLSLFTSKVSSFFSSSREQHIVYAIKLQRLLLYLHMYKPMGQYK